MQFFTRTGDKGETSLFGGKRVKKNSLRVEAYGNLDELNSFVGLALSQTKNEKIKNILTEVQNNLFICGSELATPEKANYKIPEITAEHVKKIEDFANEIGNQLGSMNKFILPGGSFEAALLHTCRTICRKSERSIVALSEKEKINEEIVKYCNRLSSLLFVLARYANKISNVKEKEWNNKS
jgi:cob(I)alamin adenosyltransferase